MTVYAVIAGSLLAAVSAGARTAALPNASDLNMALQKLNVLGAVLYVGAHPDDENTAALAYFSKGRKYRAAYLSLTRGEGGQNLIGSEQGAALGILRTQELLAARRIDGAEQFFTRAVDFGYSKTAEETFDFWGRNEILSDIVRVIRRFRPDVIISRFTAENSGGHGHHTASAILLKEAFEAAGDPRRFPEQLKSDAPWKAKRLLWNSFRSAPNEAGAPVRVDTGTYDPLLGKSFSEMAGESRSQHKSQGFGSAGRRGSQFENFELIAGEPASGDPFSGIDTTWNRVSGGGPVGKLLEGVLSAFDPKAPAKSVPGLLAAQEALGAVNDPYWGPFKRSELGRAIQACAGLWLEAIADDFAAAPGDDIHVKISAVNRSDLAVSLRRVSFSPFGSELAIDRPLKPNEPATADAAVSIPKDQPISQPYWLEEAPKAGLLSVRDPGMIGAAENPPALSALVGLTIDGRAVDVPVAVQFRSIDPAAGELYRDFSVYPPVSVRIEGQVRIFNGPAPQTIKIKVKNHSRTASGTLRLRAGEGWRVSPNGAPFNLSAKSEEAEFAFEVRPPQTPGETVLRAEAEIGELRCGRDLVEIDYPHIRRQVDFPESAVKAVRLDVKVAARKIGYIMGAGDEVPEALRTLGCDVTVLPDEMIEQADLSAYDVLVTGVRAYNTREALKRAQDRILRFVEKGGTLIVQYNVASGQLPSRIGPYPLTVGRDRVCVETAPVAFINPQHSLLNVPNVITAADFGGWIQERGLYFASQWDERYEALFSAHDPGEPDRKGGMLYARYGKGIYIYTAYSWFRELPASVPGAFRIWANLLSAGTFHGQTRSRGD
jgi:LmbE family N-acetylglucosaminyl deacetylase